MQIFNQKMSGHLIEHACLKKYIKNKIFNSTPLKTDKNIIQTS